jgi:uncharacterized phiE125 gp8 family phage protein
MSLRLVTPSADMVVSLGEAKAHLREDASDQDNVIAMYIAGAIGWLDGATGWLGRALGEQSWELTLDGFPGHRWAAEWREGSFRNLRHHDNRIVIPLPPLRSVDSIRYLDADGTSVLVDPSAYRIVDMGEQCSHVVPAAGTCWPSVQCADGAVSVRFTAGYDEIPPAIRNAILLLVGHFNENREAVNVGNIVSVMPFGVDALLSPYRVWPA